MFLRNFEAISTIFTPDHNTANTANFDNFINITNVKNKDHRHLASIIEEVLEQISWEN